MVAPWKARGIRRSTVVVVCLAMLGGGCSLFRDHSLDTSSDSGDAADVSDPHDAETEPRADARDSATDTRNPSDTRMTTADGIDTADTVVRDTDDAGDTPPPIDAADTTDTADGGDGDTANPPENLLTNPGFEQGTQADGCPADWTCVTYSPKNAGGFSVDTSVRHSGQKSARWNGSDNPDTIIKQRLSSAPGRRYHFSVWVKTKGVSNDPFVQVLFDDQSGSFLEEKEYPATDTNGTWQKIEHTTFAAPADTHQLRFNLSLSDNHGQVWWDEASLVEVTE